MSTRMVDLLHLTYVPRWGVVPMLRHQSVAEHTFRTMVIAQELWRRIFVILPEDFDLGCPPADFEHRLTYLAMLHDAPECRTGDIPSPLKSEIEAALGVNSAAEILEDCPAPWLQEEQQEAYGPPSTMPPALDELLSLADLLEAASWRAAWSQKGSHLDISIRYKQEMGLDAKSAAVGHLFGIPPAHVRSITIGILAAIRDGRPLEGS